MKRAKYNLQRKRPFIRFSMVDGNRAHAYDVKFPTWWSRAAKDVYIGKLVWRTIAVARTEAR